MKSARNGLCIEGEDTYWIKRRSNVPFPGLVKVQDANGHNLYYYFGADDKAVKNVLPEGDSDFWIPAEKTNYLLPRVGGTTDEKRRNFSMMSSSVTALSRKAASRILH